MAFFIPDSTCYVFTNNFKLLKKTKLISVYCWPRKHQIIVFNNVINLFLMHTQNTKWSFYLFYEAIAIIQLIFNVFMVFHREYQFAMKIDGRCYLKIFKLHKFNHNFEVSIVVDLILEPMSHTNTSQMASPLLELVIVISK